MKKNYFLVIFSVILGWLLLIGFSIKRTGVINTFINYTKPAVNYFYTPHEKVLSDFEGSKDFWAWDLDGSFVELSSRYASSGKHSAHVTLYSKEHGGSATPGVGLEDTNIGPRGEKDWSRFKSLRFELWNPQDAPVLLDIKIKDKAGRYAQQKIKMQSGKNNIRIDLKDIADTVDLTNIVYLKLFTGPQNEDREFYLDNVRLDREDLAKRDILEDPMVDFVSLRAPDTVRRGTEILLSCSMVALKALDKKYKAFIHISKSNELKKKSSKRRWFINADRDPLVPTSQWAESGIYEIGPERIFIPKDFQPGAYAVQIGLFNPRSRGSYSRGALNSGAFDFRTGYPRLRYASQAFKDHIVGYIEVVK
ncbi:MAG: hypothetical protein ABIJ27_00195 [Candidatus Omnitrophota bacterium]